MSVDPRVMSAYIELSMKTERIQAGVEDAKRSIRKMNREMKEQMRESQGAIALLGDQIGVAMPRHLREFVSKLPGVSRAVSAAFDSIAVIALADYVVEATEKMAKFYEKSQEATREGREAWGKLQSSLRDTSDELALQNDKLDESIAKIDKKPYNGIKEAIDEAKVASDQLLASLSESVDKIGDVVSKSKVGMISKVVDGAEGVGDIRDKFDDYQQAIHQARADNKPEAAKKAMDDFSAWIKGQREEAAKVQAKNASILDRTNSDPVFSVAQGGTPLEKDFGGYDDINKRLDILNQVSAAVDDARRQWDEREDQYKKKNYLKERDRTKREEEDKRQRQLRYQQEQIKSDELKYSQMQRAAEQIKAGGKDSTFALQQFWLDRQSVFKKGSHAYDQVQQQSLTAQREWAKQSAQILAQFHAAQGQTRVDSLGNTRAYALPPATTTHAGSDWLIAQTEKNQQIIQQAAQKIAEVQLRWQQATGAVSEYRAIVEGAALSQQQLEERVVSLKNVLAQLRQESWQTLAGNNMDPQNAAKQAAVQSQILQTQTSMYLNQMVAAQQEMENTLLGSFKRIFSGLESDAANASESIASIANNMVNSMNAALGQFAVGHKTNFQGILQDAGAQLTQLGASSTEGMLAHLFHLGLGDKAPKHVIVDNMPQGTMGGISSLARIGVPQSTIDAFTAKGGANMATSWMQNIPGLSALFGAMNNSNFFGGLAGGSLFGSGGLFQHFATGGSVRAGVPVNVGEMGPEVFVPHTGGSIIPNNRIGHGHTYNIDARGTDPVAVQQAIVHAMTVTHQRAVSDAVNIIHQHHVSTPRG